MKLLLEKLVSLSSFEKNKKCFYAFKKCIFIHIVNFYSYIYSFYHSQNQVTFRIFNEKHGEKLAQKTRSKK